MTGEHEEIAVSIADLRMISRALGQAQSSQAAWDLLEQFRALDTRPRKSNLSRALAKAHDRVVGYLDEATREEPIGEDDDGTE